MASWNKLNKDNKNSFNIDLFEHYACREFAHLYFDLHVCNILRINYYFNSSQIILSSFRLFRQCKQTTTILYFKISWPGDLPQLMHLMRWNYYAENLEQLHFQLLSDLLAEKIYVFISIINKSIPINLTDHDHQKLAKHQTTSQIPLSLLPRHVQKSDRINLDRQSGSDQLGSTRANSDQIKKEKNNKTGLGSTRIITKKQLGL